MGGRGGIHDKYESTGNGGNNLDQVAVSRLLASKLAGLNEFWCGGVLIGDRLSYVRTIPLFSLWVFTIPVYNRAAKLL